MSLPILKDKKTVDGKSAIYICKNYTCKEPITNGNELKIALTSLK
jgi:hypothetical protein